MRWYVALPVYMHIVVIQRQSGCGKYAQVLHDLSIERRMIYGRGKAVQVGYEQVYLVLSLAYLNLKPSPHGTYGSWNVFE